MVTLQASHRREYRSEYQLGPFTSITIQTTGRLLKDPFVAKVRLRRSLQSAILMLPCVLAVAGCSRNSATRTKIELVDPGASKAAVRSLATPVPPCPPAGVPPLQPGTSTGHHRVVLSWHASAPSIRPQDNAVGYCLYRSQTQNAAEKNATCSQCEQINSVPVTVTGCIDDVVQDGVTYYYVVTAISSARQLSSSSNEIPVVIPPNKPGGGTSSYPYCRGSPSAKWPPV